MTNEKKLLTEDMPENPGDLDNRNLTLEEGKIKGQDDQDLTEDEDDAKPQLLTEDL